MAIDNRVSDQIVSVREGILREVRPLQLISCYYKMGLISPEEIDVTLVTIETSHATLCAPILGIVPKKYLGKAVIVESKRVSYDAETELYDQKLFVVQPRASGFYQHGQRIAEGSVYKIKNELLPLDSLLRM